MNAASNVMAGKGKRFVERVYRLRIAGLSLGFFCVASVFSQQHRGFVLWGLLAFHGFLWPHIARRASLACEVPFRGERVNLLIDAAFGGFWVVAMHLNVLPCVLILVMLSMNNIAAGGLQLFARGVIAHLVGFAIGVAMLGFAFEPLSSMSTILACLPFLVVYPLALGFATYRISRKLSDQTRSLQRLSRIDGLTGLLNRRSWESELAAEFERCRERRYASSLLLVDLDHFKRINDTLGHPAGDAVLQAFAAMLQSHFRDTDPIGRYGGEEFGVVLPGATLTEARSVAERLVATVRDQAGREGAACPCTISVGIAQCEQDMRDHIAWLQKADASLYGAKLSGRDRVVVGEALVQS
jgi:diguanylate cyclase